LSLSLSIAGPEAILSSVPSNLSPSTGCPSIARLFPPSPIPSPTPPLSGSKLALRTTDSTRTHAHTRSTSGISPPAIERHPNSQHSFPSSTRLRPSFDASVMGLSVEMGFGYGVAAQRDRTHSTQRTSPSLRERCPAHHRQTAQRLPCLLQHDGDASCSLALCVRRRAARRFQQETSDQHPQLAPQHDGSTRFTIIDDDANTFPPPNSTASMHTPTILPQPNRRRLKPRDHSLLSCSTTRRTERDDESR
ncbi:hypothetical protein SCHPADRAFT_911985, partial [Schizopora paradoxa]